MIDAHVYLAWGTAGWLPRPRPSFTEKVFNPMDDLRMGGVGLLPSNR